MNSPYELVQIKPPANWRHCRLGTEGRIACCSGEDAYPSLPRGDPLGAVRLFTPERWDVPGWMFGLAGANGLYRGCMRHSKRGYTVSMASATVCIATHVMVARMVAGYLGNAGTRRVGHALPQRVDRDRCDCSMTTALRLRRCGELQRHQREYQHEQECAHHPDFIGRSFTAAGHERSAIPVLASRPEAQMR